MVVAVRQGEEKMTSVPVVTAADDFSARLRTGDILLFDKLSSANQLVQWGDNRPVGHCGIWKEGEVLGGGRNKGFVFEAKWRTLTGGSDAISDVSDTPFQDLLAETI